MSKGRKKKVKKNSMQWREGGGVEGRKEWRRECVEVEEEGGGRQNNTSS